MNKFWTIFKSEYAQVVKKKSFLIGLILTPAFMIVVTIVPTLLANRDIQAPSEYAVVDADGRGVGQKFVESLKKERLTKDSSVEAYTLTRLYDMTGKGKEQIDALRVELDSLIVTKGLTNYVIIFPNAENSDSVMLVSKAINFKTSARFDKSISNILAAMRLKKSSVNLPVDSVLTMTRRIDMIQGSPGGKTRNFMSMYLGGIIFVMILFMSVIGFGGILMRTVIDEKNSRVMEILISSVSPFQLMMGKVLGLGAANLTQVGIWVAMGLMLYSYRGNLHIPAEVGTVLFNPVIIVFFVAFLVLAYIMYATLFALIGSICSTEKETQNFMFPITMSLMLPVFIMMYIIQEPDSLATVILSLIPLFTPTMMVLRLNIMAPEVFRFSDPIILEATIGVVLTALFTVGVIWVTSRVFRMGILMYGKRATLPEIMKWIRYK